MVQQAGFFLQYRNPDVLTSIANLSSDEVFTPPSFANRMLDTVEEAWAKNNDGANIWEDKTVTFLDPFTKSGVFLREITRRLSKGLEKEIPDTQERVNHILTKQVFGVAITQLTALLARRSVYCSKYANGEHSICTEFDSEEGNIWFQRTEHTWVGGKEKVITFDYSGNEIEKTLDGSCKFCGAKQKEYERGPDAETHAYSLIHTSDPNKWAAETFGEDMQFDVIIGNPPYQLDTGGSGRQATPIYPHFIEQAKKLNPKVLTMIIPARWYSGGMGLDKFRDTMLDDSKIAAIHDFPTTEDVFPGTQVKGGICYFLRDSAHQGHPAVIRHSGQGVVSTATRPLRFPGSRLMVRYSEAVAILEKVEAESNEPHVKNVNTGSFSDLVSSISPFGLDSSFKGKPSEFRGSVKVFRNAGVGHIAKQSIPKGQDLISRHKIYVSEAYGAGDGFPHQIIGKPILGLPGTACSWTYLLVGPFDSQGEAANCMSYMATKFFRFLVLQRKPTQHATRQTYGFVPTQDFSKPWTDRELYSKYKLTPEEIDFIENMIRPMELGDA